MGGRQVRKDPDQLFDHYLAEYTWGSQPPVVPDANGHYPIAMPGQTPAF